MYHIYHKFPKIDLDDIILRELLDDDAEDYFSYMSRKEMSEFLTNANCPKDLSEALEEINYWGSLFRNKRSVYWGIALKSNNQLIGTAGFNIISQLHQKAEISYDLNPDYWGRGIMTRSIASILQFADVELKLVRIQATVIQNNLNSIKLLDRCGFIKEGNMKKFEIINGIHKDYYMYARIV